MTYMPSVLETSRLILAPVGRDDVDALHRLWVTPGVRRFLWDNEVISVDRAAAVIEESIRLNTEQGIGLWRASFRDDPARILGFAGFWNFRDPPELELLYGVAEEQWGHGIALELGQALIQYGFGQLGFDEIRASTDLDNRASARVLEKLGFRFERRAVAAGRDTLFYSLQRSITRG